MEQRIQFIMAVLDDTYSMYELCHRYGISRKTGYKWLSRYLDGGLEALSDRSRAPHRHPHEIVGSIKQAILAVKERFSRWGAPKIRIRLERDYPDWDHYPAVSTIGLFLQHQHLTRRHKRRHRASPTVLPLTQGHSVNQVWCADFKGHFKTADGHQCNPLTISDHASRYLFCCRHVDQMRCDPVKRCFEHVFRQYGLPEVIRTDNGSPFASVGLGGLSRLSYWWIRLGIYPERIAPGHPEQNGRHERMHKTLKADTATSPAKTLSAQQARFNAFRKDYNEERPHEALQMRTPSDCYYRSPREYPSHLPPVTYPDTMRVRRVKSSGEIKLDNKLLYVAQSLAGELVGIEPFEEECSQLWYCNYLLGRIDHRQGRIMPTKPTSFVGPVNRTTDEHNCEKVSPMSSV
jgi:putative transposase